MAQGDFCHVGAEGLRGQRHNPATVGKAGCKAVDQIYFRTHHKHWRRGAVGKTFGFLDEIGRGTGAVAGLNEFGAAFGMGGHKTAGVGGAGLRHGRRGDDVMNGTAAGPEQQAFLQAGILFFRGREPVGVQRKRMLLFFGDAQLTGRIAPQIAIRQEKHAVALFQGPAEHGGRVGRRADRAAKFAYDSLESQRGIDVGQRRYFPSEGAQAFKHGARLRGGGHARHLAVGVGSGNMHGLFRRGQQRRGFAHEVHAAEDNVLRADIGHAPGQFQGVAGNVAEGDNGVILIVMPHDAHGVAETTPERGNFVN